MKIESLWIDRFGILRDKRLERLSPNVEVIYGPNEAGKTTFLQFIRCMLFGLHGARNYSAGQGQKFGGSLTFLKPVPGESYQRLTVSRYLRLPGDSSVTEAERVELANESGQRLGLEKLDVLLGEVDFALYGSIFAVSQDDVNTIGLINSQSAQEALYQISLASPGVSLMEMRSKLEKNRRELINNSTDDSFPSAGAFQNLIDKRQEILSRLESADSRQADSQRLLDKIPELERQINTCESQQAENQQKLAEIERIERAFPLYSQLRQLGAQTNSTDISPPVTSYALKQAQDLEAENARLKLHLEQIKQQYNLQAGKTAKPVLPTETEIPESVQNLINRKRDFARCNELKSQLRQIQDRLETACQTLDLPDNFSEENIPPQNEFDNLHAVWNKKDEQRDEVEFVPVLQHKSAAAAPVSFDDGKKKLTAINQRLGLLREKIRWIERRNDLAWGESHLRNKLIELTTSAPISASMRYALIGISCLGGLGLFLWTIHLFGWLSKESTLGSLGPVGVVFCFCGLAGVAILRYLLEKSAEERLIECRNQWDSTRNQLEKHEAIRSELETKLRENSESFPLAPLHSGETTDELADTRNAISQLLTKAKEAEKEIYRAKSEDSKPVEEEKSDAAASTQKIVKSVNVYSLEEWRALWAEALSKAGLPRDWSIDRVNTLQKKANWLKEGFAKERKTQEQVSEAETALAPVREQLRALAVEKNVNQSVYSEPEQIDIIAQSYKTAVSPVQPQPDTVKEELRLAIVQKESEYNLSRHKLDFILQSYSVSSRADLESLYKNQQAAAERSQKKSALMQQIQSALQTAFTDENQLNSFMDNYPGLGAISQIRVSLQKQNQEAGSQKKTAEERIAFLRRQANEVLCLQRQAEDKVRLEELEEEIAQAARQWRGLAMAETITERLILQYEQKRQPETLMEASEYFNTITQGAYTRIWKPTDSNQLLLERADGQNYEISQLSTGTREQLYLCLRLALASWFARKGVVLPLVLDDALINFDSRRAKGSAKLLMDFSRKGIQVILFTCHKSVRDVFEKCGVAVRRF